MIGTAIYSLLRASAGLSAMGTRIFPVRATQRASMPYIVYNVVSLVPTDSKSGGTGFDKYRVQVDVYDDDFASVETYSAAIRTALDRKTGTYGSETVITIVFDDMNDIALGYEEDSVQVFARALDFMVITK